MIELVVVLVIVGVVSALAATDLASFIGRYRLNSAAEELADSIHECRMMAIAENRECAVRLVTSDANLTGDWRQNAGRYEVLVSEVTATGVGWVSAPDGVHDLAGGPNGQPGVSIEPWTPLVGPIGGSLADAFVFNPRGYAANQVSDFAAGGVARIVLRNKRSTSIEQRVVRVDRGGNVQIAVP